MQYVTVASVEQIPPGQTRLVQVGTCPILVIHDAGRFYALHGLCGHQNLSLAGGVVWQGVLDCPWHHFQYDIHTGENLYPKAVYPLQALPHLCRQIQPLPTYPVRLINGEVQVGVTADCQEPLEREQRTWTAKNF